jgi:N-methylhydantoinase B/oxoprolinase/acetone carboxylase alpha subunit
MDSVDNLMANTRNNPIEELDQRFPMRCDQYELRPEPAAPGKWRGGVGIIRRNRFLVDGTYSCEGDRQTDPPRGVFGGWDGLVASCRKNPDTGHEEILPAKVTGIPFAAGEFIEFREPNAAGYGDPLERPAEAVREDVLDDFTTIELARDAYGVVFADERTLEIDDAATEARRAELRANRTSGSLTDYFADRPLPSVSPPTSVASNRELGIA